jgi:hypothetical protein
MTISRNDYRFLKNKKILVDPPQTWLAAAGPCGPMVRCNTNAALPHGTVLAYGTGTILACRATGTVLACGIVSWILGLRFSFGTVGLALGVLGDSQIVI